MPYRKFFIAALFLLMSLTGLAQTLPPCFAANHIGKASKLQPWPLKLADGHTVYRLYTKTPLRCLACNTEVTYYDSACNIVAIFTTKPVAKMIIKPGYKASSFAESNFPVFAKLIKKPAPVSAAHDYPLTDTDTGITPKEMPACIAAAIVHKDSLVAARVSSVREVLLAGKTVYYFEHTQVKNNHCYDCATVTTFYDDHCGIAATFSVGGIAGIRASNGFTAADLANMRTIKILWTAPAVQ